MTGTPLIRNAAASDLNSLVEIYNHYVTETHITFDVEPFAVGARTQWFTQFADSGPYRLLIADHDGEVRGYACSTQFKPRAAYNTSVETTVYLHPDHTGKGLGPVLYGALVEQLEEEPGVHRAYGGVALPNDASIRLHEALGFKQVATYHEVGFKFGRYWDVSWFEREM